ncbi:hypothetical protein G5714_013254 [Onychostoma macrolepis]|uniref:Uncharacterized protein n=1 Tax=Onychostoma macrolepis TaxID=369639 RepID=A0A7J6CIN4_9TELE|nr:hypothetical protein G5714_013254 [Onychostoma macrolepis]
MPLPKGSFSVCFQPGLDCFLCWSVRMSWRSLSPLLQPQGQKTNKANEVICLSALREAFGFPDRAGREENVRVSVCVFERVSHSKAKDGELCEIKAMVTLLRYCCQTQGLTYMYNICNDVQPSKIVMTS